MKEISENVIRNISNRAIQVESGVINNRCDNISKTIGHLIKNRFDIQTYIVETPVDGSEHYSCVVPGKYVLNYSDTDFVIIDATIRQFSDTYPQIVIENHKDCSYYDKIKLPDYKIKEESDEN